MMNNRFTNTDYNIRNQAFHFNDRTIMPKIILAVNVTVSCNKWPF